MLDYFEMKQSYLIHQAFITYYSMILDNMELILDEEEKNPQLKLSKTMQFDAVADINMSKK